MFKVTVTLKIVQRLTMTKTRAFLVTAKSASEAKVLVIYALSPEWARADIQVEEVAPVMELRSTHSAAIPS